jgi:putative FmdB family regulatory protein
VPTYEFYCEKCKNSFSIVLSLSEYENKKYNCPTCKAKELKQQITSFQTVTSKKSI